jgi:nucleotide-binding universal stress UspA family protein
MFAPERILHPTDFSDSARSAFRYAVHIAEQHDADLHVLHVVTDFGVDPVRGAFESGVDEEAYYERLESEAERQLQQLREDASRAGVQLKTTTRRHPDPETAICAVAEEKKMDVIAMGTHGRRALSRMMLGSVAESVMRQAPCAVLTVREGDVPEDIAVQKILTPVDLSEYSVPLLREAADVANTFGATLDVLHVVEPLPFPVPLVGGFTLNDLAVEPTQRAEEQVNDCLKRAGVSSPPARMHLEEGHAAMTILDAAGDLEADLICIASHGLSGMTRMLVGSVTARVVRRASCPVLTLRVEAEERGDDADQPPEDEATSSDEAAPPSESASS